MGAKDVMHVCVSTVYRAAPPLTLKNTRIPFNIAFVCLTDPSEKSMEIGQRQLLSQHTYQPPGHQKFTTPTTKFREPNDKVALTADLDFLQLHLLTVLRTNTVLIYSG